MSRKLSFKIRKVMRICENAKGILKLISQGEKDIQDGKSKSQQKVFVDIENILKEKKEMKL